MIFFLQIPRYSRRYFRYRQCSLLSSGSELKRFDNALQYTFETIAESPISYVALAKFKDSNQEWPVAIKTASYLAEFSKEPHDIVKELRLLSSISHINVSTTSEICSCNIAHTDTRSLKYLATRTSRTLNAFNFGCPSYLIHFLTYYPLYCSRHTCRPELVLERIPVKTNSWFWRSP